MGKAFASLWLLSFVLISLFILESNPATAGTAADICGDANGDQQVNIGDAIYLINYVFSGGPAPDPLELGDANLDGMPNIADVIWIINYIFKDGPAPCEPSIGLGGFCLDGVPYLELTNNGPDISNLQTYSILYENGNSSGAAFQLLDNETDTIGLSNMYGGCNVTLDASGQSIDMDNCLTPYFTDFMGSIDFNAFIPTPAMAGVAVSFCTYDVYIYNMVYDSATVILTPTVDGMQMHCTYYYITADLDFASHGGLCPNATGTAIIDSTVVDADMIFTITPEETVDVTFTGTTVIVHNPVVNVDGPFGSILESVINSYISDFMADFETELAVQFQAVMEPLLENILVP